MKNAQKEAGMMREGTLDEISDGRFYEANDMVKADCQGCEGCHACCEGMGDTLLLDPLDVHRLAVFLGKTAASLLEGELSLAVQDGLILPYPAVVGEKETCIFLDGNGRCRVHAARPGYCRIFPLGRYYEDGEFSYILQIHECDRRKTKVKVKKWVDTPELARYERFVRDWHYFVRELQQKLASSGDPDYVRKVNLFFLRAFYQKEYEPEGDFYEQFYDRLRKARAIFA